MKKYFLLLIFLFLLFPYRVFGLELLPNSKAGILIEASSGKIIYENNKDERLSVASMTKMVAQIIILDEIRNMKISLDDIVTASYNASSMGGSQIYLEDGEKMSVRDLLKGISVASGNDATVAMAEYISGSEENFVKRMNAVVKKLKLKNTHFVNCTGLDEKDHYSSAYDMAMIARELVTNYPEILEFSSIYEDYLRTNTSNKFWLVNTNKLVHLYSGCDGLKTGHTDDAGYSMAATASRNGLRLIGIVLGESDSNVRNREMMEMLDYGFNSIKMNCILKKGTVVNKIKIDKTDKKKYDVVLKNDLCIIEDKTDYFKYDYKVDVNKFKLPISSQESIGKIYVYNKDKYISSGDVVLNEDVKKMNVVKFIFENVYNLFFGLF